MLIDNTLKISFLVSIGLHSIILFLIPYFKIPQMQKNPKKFEIVYLKPEKEKVIKELTLDKEKMQRFDDSAYKQPPPTFMKKEDLFREKELAAKKPELALTEINTEVPKPKITLPPVEQKKINNPAYTNYDQIVREKIKSFAYRNYSRWDTGKVSVSFIIIKDGSLGGIHIMQDSSVDNEYLKAISLKSVKDSAPFDPFPKELPYAELTFSIEIYFEAE